MRQPLAVGTMLAAALLPMATAGAADSGVDLYEAAIRSMATLPIPPYIAYRLEGQGEWPRPLQTLLRVDRKKQVWLEFSPGTSHATWSVLHRSRDFSNAITDEGRSSYYTPRSFFDITWDGAYHALHDGILFNAVQRDPRPIPTSAARAAGDCAIGTISAVSVPGAYNVHETGATPHPVATPSSAPCIPETQALRDPNLRTIALVRVMGPSVYGVTDAGTVNCENGEPGRLLHFTPRSDPEAHQLTDAIVDVRSMRFCMMRFTRPNGGTVEQHYADVGGYWLETGGIISFDFPVSLFGRNHSFTWVYRIKEVTFPARVPDDEFTSQLRTATNAAAPVLLRDRNRPLQHDRLQSRIRTSAA